MNIIQTINEMKRVRSSLPQPIGFVPTMGYLHEGHIALVKKAREENSSVVVSIFVNPTQFGPNEDFTEYPRDPQHDLDLLAAEKTDVVFMPSPIEMYPREFNTWVEVDRITERLEGTSRPDHFKGVATVVAKLFNIVQPNVAYFGQKDAQQLAVIKKMVTDLNMNLNIVAIPTVREPDGLAMSSRNIYLNVEERQAAIAINRSLNEVQQLFSQGEHNAELLRRLISETINNQPLLSIDYISIANPDTFDELSEVNQPALVSMAIKVGKTRLIDNIILE